MSEINYVNKDKKYYSVNNIQDKKKFQNYISIIAIALLILGAVLIIASVGKIDSIANNETGNVDYTVYLKDNDFYTNKFLQKGDGEVNNYIASLIDTVNVNFSYSNTYSDVVDYEYEYDIDAKILVTDKYDGSKVLYSKDEALVEPTSLEGRDNKFDINKSVDINYDKYNSYVSAFKETYALDVDSSLILTMNISHRGAYKDKQIDNKVSSLTMLIPLTKNTIDISINTNELANNFNIPIDESVIENQYLFITGVVICVLSFISLGLMIILNRKKNDIYRKEIDKLLKNYDRLIITSKQPSIDESNYKNKVRVMSFEELIDVNELTNEPIIYYEVEPGEKSYFIILKQDTLYKLTISKKYLEEHKDDKKEIGEDEEKED